jgi:hypothetical protein
VKLACNQSAAGSYRLAIVALFVIACACARASPAGFWSTYRPDLIKNDDSDQGPWGGVRWIHWTSPTPGTFRAAALLEFARSKGWSCKEPVTYSASQLRLWTFAARPVFPLHFGPADHQPDNQAVLNFPRFIADDSLISECRTGWMRVEPGSGKDTDALGYIQIDRGRTSARRRLSPLGGDLSANRERVLSSAARLCATPCRTRRSGRSGGATATSATE